jgi:L-asparaginase
MRRSQVAAPALPKVAIFATGGTIASPVEIGGGATPRLNARDLVMAVPELAKIAEISAISFRQTSSSELTVPDLVELVESMSRRVSAGAEGVVVTQGTDSLEETAFVLDLLWDRATPVVVTGAMRNPSLPSADGPANILAAVQVASSSATRDFGCLVVFNNDIHASRFVQKTHTSSLSTFRSMPTGPIGWLSEDRVRIAVRPIGRHHIWPGHAAPPAIALLKIGLGDDGRLIEVIEGHRFAGLVVEAFGGGHLPRVMAEPLERLCARIPVVLASRICSGELLTRTYGFPGSEKDLLSRGLIPAGFLTGLKARLLLMLLLTRDATREQIAEAFLKVGIPGSGDFRLDKTSFHTGPRDHSR